MPPRVHLITDFTTLGPAALDRLVEAAEAGVDAIQVRAKAAVDRDLVAWTASAVAAVRPLGVKVLVNDRLDIALAAGADGVHLGIEDLPVAAARALSPDGFLVGATCRAPDQARRARRDGADYAGVGPVHPSTTKVGLPEPIGLDALRASAQEIPAIAIGGITAARVPAVMATGAHGVAVVAAVWGAPDPALAAREIADLVRAA